MKTCILLLTLLVIQIQLFAQQNIGVGTTSPHISSMLDITSTTKGLLIPRMTYTQRTAINSPALGLMVFQTNAQGFNTAGLYYFDGSIWKRFARLDEIGGSGGGTGTWTAVSDDQYSNVTGNVGIGTSSPTSKFHLVGNLLQESGTYTLNHPTGILQLQNGGINKVYFQLSGNNLRMGTNSGNTGGKVIVRMNGSENLVVDSTGYVGIGTSTPDNRLHVKDGNIKLENPGSSQFGFPFITSLDVEISTEDEKKGGVQFRRNGAQIGHMFYVADADHPNYISMSAENASKKDLLVSENGRVGVNMNMTNFTPLGQLQIRAAENTDAVALHTALASESPTIQFYNSNSSGPLDKKAFMQLADGDDLRLGTNSGNSTGKLIVRMNSSDIAAFTDNGNLGISTITPAARLHILNGNDADPNPFVGNGYILLGDVVSTNIAMDNNEIMARNGLNPGNLILQNDGGDVQVGSNSRLFVDNNGNTGLGTNTPSTKLQIIGGSGASLSTHGYAQFGPTNSTNLVLDNNEIMARNNGGGSTMYLNRLGGNLEIGGYTTINTGGSGEVMRLTGLSPALGFNHGTDYSFIQQQYDRFLIGVNGNPLQLDATQVVIGAYNPDATEFKLTVGGKIVCEEVRVQLFDDWPDYVFADHYQLQPLHELKSFIQTNHHLPNIPKATEVQEKGIDVGEMNRKLLEKVEELTLYVIQLQEQVDELKKRN